MDNKTLMSLIMPIFRFIGTKIVTKLRPDGISFRPAGMTGLSNQHFNPLPFLILIIPI